MMFWSDSFRHRQNNFLQIGIARGIADHDFKFARLDDVFHLHVVKRQRFRRDFEVTVLRFARLQRNFLEAFQFLDRPSDGADAVADVHLRRLPCRRACRCWSRRPRHAWSSWRLIFFFASRTFLIVQNSCSSSRSRTETAAKRRQTKSRAGPRVCNCKTPAGARRSAGMEMGSLPPGLKSPNKTSATAWPHSWPRYQHSKMAGTC